MLRGPEDKITSVLAALNTDMLRAFGTLTLLLSCAGCPGSETPKPVDLATVPAVAAVTILTDVRDCPPLAAVPENASAQVQALRPIAEAARALSCKPEVFGMSDADALAALEISEGVEVTLSRGSARLELPDGVRAVDLAAALGLESPKMKAQDGSKRMSWRLVASDGSTPNPWGVGELSAFLVPPEDVSAKVGDVLPISPEAEVVSALWVAIPEDTIRFEADPHAAAAVTNALLALSNDPALLQLNPQMAHEKLDALGERFELTKWSSSAGGGGFHVRPRRAELLASDFADQMKLRSPKHTQIDIHDAEPDRLASGGETTFEWQGLELEVEISEIDGGGRGLKGWRVEWIQVGARAK